MNKELNGIKLIYGNSNPELAMKIGERLGVEPVRAKVKKFSDGETLVEVGENVRGADSFVIQSHSDPVNDSIMEQLVIMDALKRASAGRITAVIPYYGYARQDQKNKPRVPISARLIADLLTVAGAHRVLTMELHAGQIQGFFNIPVDNLFASPIHLPYIREHFNDDLVMVSPDAGGVVRARAYATKLGVGLALIDKRRADINKAEAMHLIGDVGGKTAIILDDMTDTAGTLIEAAKTIMENDAEAVHALCTHAVLSGPAIERLHNSQLGSLVVTDTLPRRLEAESLNILKVLTSAKLFADAIKSIHDEDSISRLFEIQH